MVPRRVRLAVLIAFLCHGLFIVTARYRLSYDAYTHMLFADHYARDWFSLWDPRWYTGFTVVSYPPLTHQLIGLLIPAFGFDAAYALLLWAVTALYPLGVFAFARIFTGRTTSAYAALAAAILLPIYVTAHIFGQLPFLLSTLLALFGAAALARFLHSGGAQDWALAWILSTAMMAAHHATLLFQPFLIGAVMVSMLDSRNWRTLLARTALYILPAVMAGLAVIWPFWEWGLHQTMQTPIDHASRHNFFTDPVAPAIFFWPLYGPLVGVIPFVLFRKWPLRFSGLLLSFALLFVLGLGGTTPVPRWLFSDGWAWLTYDRFAFWASLCLLPFFGSIFISIRRAWKPWVIPWPVPLRFQRTVIPVFTFLLFAATALSAWFSPILIPAQPGPIDMDPIVDFLAEGDRSDWRYLTFGFGDQYVRLNLLTKATTIDGTYHTARALPELRTSGVGQIDSSLWLPGGLAGIEPILERSGDRGVRWGFVNHNGFVPVLRTTGWRFVGYLPNGIRVWENPSAVKPVPRLPPPQDPLASFSWGVLPLLAFVSAVTAGALRIRPVDTLKTLQGIHAFLVGLIPIGLCFWYFIPLAEFPHERVYFTYSSALFYLVDAPAALAALSWCLSRAFTPRTAEGIPVGRQHLQTKVSFWLTLLCILVTLSIFWSLDWRVSAYMSVHMWLMLALFLSLRDWPGAWKAAMLGFCAGLGLQAFAGVIEFAFQSTALLAPLALEWPGILDASVRGASILRTLSGMLYLRLYGTLPHPNLLGSFALVFLAGPASLFLRKKRPNHPAFALFAFGIAVIGLTFSRAAWLGLIALALVLLWKSRFLETRRLYALVIAGVCAAVVVLYPLREFVFTRVSNSPVRTEQISISGRLWLTEQALDMIRARPLTGVGAGAFVLQLARQAEEGPSIEPVHDLPLLIFSELGLPGLVVMIGLLVSIVPALVKAVRPSEILIGAALTGLAVTSLFDHNLWSLAPGRILLFMVLGLWAGQAKQLRSSTQVGIPSLPSRPSV
jgi:O-antigen ligase